MSLILLFFLLRLAGAILLLAFLGLIFWYIFQDVRAARFVSPGVTAYQGALRVMESSLPDMPVNSLIDLAPVTTIGRNLRNTIVLEDSFVSGDHAVVTWRDARWWLEDLDSRNGTLLNDVPILSPVVISDGDIIILGSVKFRLETPGKQR